MTTVAELSEAGIAFVEATVVRCASPTSARPGDRALVLGDGTIEGFVGGSCADATVRLQALRVLETGEPVLLKILPGDEDGPSDEEGAVVARNPCLSGGALELFLEPHLPAPRVAVAGEGPIARTFCDLAARVGFAVRAGVVSEPGDFGAVIASLGHGDEEAVRQALEARCEYVALVASRTRGAAVLAALRAAGAPASDLARVRTPAGLDIGARTHEEIALSILAELVATRRAPAVPSAGPALPVTAAAPSSAGGRTSASPADDSAAEAALPAAASEVAEAVDPVCGMTVAVTAATPTAGGHAFCCEGCRDAWRAHAAAD